MVNMLFIQNDVVMGVHVYSLCIYNGKHERIVRDPNVIDLGFNLYRTLHDTSWLFTVTESTGVNRLRSYLSFSYVNPFFSL